MGLPMSAWIVHTRVDSPAAVCCVVNSHGLCIEFVHRYAECLVYMLLVSISLRVSLPDIAGLCCPGNATLSTCARLSVGYVNYRTRARVSIGQCCLRFVCICPDRVVGGYNTLPFAVLSSEFDSI